MAFDNNIHTYIGADVHANRPATPNVAQSALFFETDTKNAFMWDPVAAAFAQITGSPSTTLSATTTLTSSHFNKFVLVDATSGAAIITLPATGSTDVFIAVSKSDSGANRVTVKNSSGTDVAWLSAQYDRVMFAWWGSAWVPVWYSILPITDVFTSNGTWTKAPLAKSVEAVCIGGGAGGGSGRCAASGAGCSGGQGGQGGVLSRWRYRAADVSATETITIGAAGSGGAAQSTNSTDGNPGGAGGNTTFGSHLRGLGGIAGAAGTATGPAAYAAVDCLSGCQAQAAGSTPIVAATGSAPQSSSGCGNGGGGGYYDTSAAIGFGFPGAAGSICGSGVVLGGAAGRVPPLGAGGSGTSISDSVNQQGGGGGGGGYVNNAGGAGGTPGGGGGGGGASLNGGSSGAGGAGARGEARVTTYF